MILSPFYQLFNLAKLPHNLIMIRFRLHFTPDIKPHPLFACVEIAVVNILEILVKANAAAFGAILVTVCPKSVKLCDPRTAEAGTA
jgi:hypothetical protein